MVSLSFDLVWPPVIGGLMIGVSTLLMLVMLGRITGISGILWQGIQGAVSFQFKSNLWRFCFLVGLPLGGFLIHWALSLPIPDFSHRPFAIIILSGFLVGLGVRLGSGCTSGHGICGIARLSPRSITATLTFMALGIVTVFLVGA